MISVVEKCVDIGRIKLKPSGGVRYLQDFSAVLDSLVRPGVEDVFDRSVTHAIVESGE